MSSAEAGWAATDADGDGFADDGDGSGAGAVLKAGGGEGMGLVCCYGAGGEGVIVAAGRAATGGGWSDRP